MSPYRLLFVHPFCSNCAAIQRSLTQDSSLPTDNLKLLSPVEIDDASLAQLAADRPDVVAVHLSESNLGNGPDLVSGPDLGNTAPGIERIQRIKALGEGRLKVLVLTEHQDPPTVLRAFAAGANSYCCIQNKSMSALVEVIQATAQGQSWIDPAIAPIILAQLRAAVTSTRFSSSGQDALPLASPLSARQLQVLQLIVDGYNNAEIAVQLQIGIGTVKTHIRHILSKLTVSDRTQAAVRALRMGLVR